MCYGSAPVGIVPTEVGEVIDIQAPGVSACSMSWSGYVQDYVS